MTWTALMALYLVANVWYTLMLKASPLPKADKYVTYAVMSSVILLSAVVLIPFGIVDLAPDSSIYGLIILQAVFFAGVNLLNILALNHTDASVFTIVNSFRIVLVTILSALILKDLPPTLQIVGGAFIFVSILVLKLHKNKRYLSKPIIYSIVAMTWVSVNVIAEKNLLAKTNVATMVFWTSLLIAPTMWCVVALRKGSFNQSRKHLMHKNTIWLMIMRPTSAWSYSLAVSIGSVAVTNYISSLSVVFVVIFGIIYLNEREEMRQKLISISIAFIGLTLIFLGKL